MWSAAASLAAPPWGTLCCPGSLQWSLPSTQHGLQCSGKSRFPTCQRELTPTLVTGVCFITATAAHPWSQLSSLVAHSCSHEFFRKPWAFTTWGTVTSVCRLPRFYNSVLSQMLFYGLEELLCLPMEMVVLCHSNIHSSADASAPGDMVREEGRSGVGSRCVAGAATALISSAIPDSFCWEPLLGSTSPEGAFSSGCSGSGSCCRL